MEKAKRAKQEQQTKQLKQYSQKPSFAKLSASALGLSLGILGSFLTLLLVIYINTTGEINDSSLSLLGSIEGSIFAIINSFIEFALLGVIIAWLYNRFAR